MSDLKKNDYLEHYENGIKIKQEIEIDYKGLSFTESSSDVLFYLYKTISSQVWMTFLHQS